LPLPPAIIGKPPERLTKGITNQAPAHPTSDETGALELREGFHVQLCWRQQTVVASERAYEFTFVDQAVAIYRC